MMAGRLNYEERKFILKYYWKYEDAVEMRSFKKNHQRELPSLESESLKLMENNVIQRLESQRH